MAVKKADYSLTNYFYSEITSTSEVFLYAPCPKAKIRLLVSLKVIEMSSDFWNEITLIWIFLPRKETVTAHFITDITSLSQVLQDFSSSGYLCSEKSYEF